MLWYYVGSLIVGSVFVVPMLLGGFDSDTDFDFGGDGDLDLDFDGDIDTDVGDSNVDIGSGTSVGIGDFAAGLVSVRSIAFFLTFFGLSGTVLTSMSDNATMVLAVSIALGLTSALLNSAAFTMLKAAQNTSHISSYDMEGRPANVVVPIEPGRRGKVRIDISGQPQYLVASGCDGTESLEVGHPVVVVSISDGVAEVASMKGLAPDDEQAQLEP